MTKRKFYRTIFPIEVLSEKPLGNIGLNELVYALTDGGEVTGMVRRGKRTTLSGAQMAKALRSQGKSPRLFFLHADGSDSD